MNNGEERKCIVLPIAVIDGDNPNKWKPFGEKLFKDLINAAKKSAKPFAVRSYLLERYQVEVEPLMVGPEALEKQSYLNKVVGIVIDASPEDGEDKAKFYQRKLDVLEKLYIRQVGQEDEALFKKFGYQVWFVTKDSAPNDAAADFDRNVRNMLGMRLNV